jgi:uncharacterized damage-inducible protein DinB
MLYRMRAVLSLAIAAVPLWAEAGAPLYPMQDFIDNWKTSKAFTLEVAEAMPAEFYDFKVAPEEMSFGGLMLHIAFANATRFASLSGTKNPLPQPDKLEKKLVLSILAQSFDFCIAQLPKLTKEQLEKGVNVDWRGRPDVSGRQLLIGMFVHTAHHRAQAEVYLRAKGFKPPVYEF